MAEKRVFVGREGYLKEFDEFINTPSSNLDGQVLLVVGEEGMGKTALLQAMAKRASDQDHVVALGEIDKRQSDFSEQIYPLIAQIKAKQKLKIGEGSDWLKAGITGFAIAAGIVFAGATAALAGGAFSLGGLLVDIRKRHIATGSSPLTLVELLHNELAEVDRTIRGGMRIVLFADPEKESPLDIIPLLRQLVAKGMPQRVRFIVAQRVKDAVIQAYEKGELRGVCSEPMRLALLPDHEEIAFIETRDTTGRLSENVRADLVSKFKGWPLLLDLATTELLKREGEITGDDVKSLPSDIDGFWRRRYGNIQNANSLKLVQTACLLPHPYPVDTLARFAGLQPSSMAAALNDPSVGELLERVSYEDTLTPRLWDECPYPKHATARDFVCAEVNKFKDLKNTLLGQIISHYKDTIGEDLTGAAVDRDALVFLFPCLIEKGEIHDFFVQGRRLQPIKLRYGLLDSFIADHLTALAIEKKLGNKERMAILCGNIGNVFQIRGELDKAMEMCRKALALDEEVGNKKGMASHYGNMGIVYQIRGELDKAMEMYDKSLALDEELGNKEGMANQYGNIGNVFQIRGELDKAMEMCRKALALDEELGNKKGMASVYGNMGNVFQIRGELDKAMEMYGKALVLNEELGRKEGMASDYGNMGVVYRIRGDLDKAEEVWTRSLKLYEALETTDKIVKVRGWLGGLRAKSS